MFDNSEDRKSMPKVYCKSILRGLIVSIVLLIIISLVFYFTKLSEGYMNTSVWIVTIVSICYSSIYGSYNIGKRGYLHGALIGLIYMLILVIIAVLSERGVINTASTLIMLGMSLLVGMLSGMIGMVLKGRN